MKNPIIFNEYRQKYARHQGLKMSFSDGEWGLLDKRERGYFRLLIYSTGRNMNYEKCLLFSFSKQRNMGWLLNPCKSCVYFYDFNKNLHSYYITSQIIFQLRIIFSQREVLSRIKKYRNLGDWRLEFYITSRVMFIYFSFCD